MLFYAYPEPPNLAVTATNRIAATPSASYRHRALFLVPRGTARPRIRAMAGEFFSCLLCLDVLTTFVLCIGVCSPALAAALNGPQGVLGDGAGGAWIADTGNSAVRRLFANGTIITWAGNGSAAYFGDGGPASAACLSSPTCIASDGSGGLLVADSGNAVVRRISAAGVISCVAGTPLVRTYTGDGGPATLATAGNVRGGCPSFPMPLRLLEADWCAHPLLQVLLETAVVASPLPTLFFLLCGMCLRPASSARSRAQVLVLLGQSAKEAQREPLHAIHRLRL